VEETASQIILMNVVFVFFTFTFGISISSSALVGKEIGSGNIKQARRFAKFVQIYGLMQSAVFSAFIYFGADFISKSFTNIPSV
jgi:Na+-driven multidrug efflux pump